MLVVATIFCATLPRAPVRLTGLERGIASLASTQGVIQIDAENVRGKSGFRLGHDALLAATAEWANAHELRGRVVVCIDHGKAHEGYYNRRHGIGIIFAGPHQKADDVLARDVGYFSSVQRRDSIVVTADGGLRKRCRQKAHSSRRLHLVQPTKFIESLYSAANAAKPPSDSQGDGVNQLILDTKSAEELQILDQKLQITKSARKRAKMMRARDDLLAQLESRPTRDHGPAALMALDAYRAEDREEGDTASEAVVLCGYQANLTDDEILVLEEGMDSLSTAGIADARGTNLAGSRREKTWEREILAERLRCTLLESDDDLLRPERSTAADKEGGAGPPSTDTIGSASAPESDPSSPVEEYVGWLNSQVAKHGAPPAWLRTTTLAKGTSRAVRVAETSADVSITDFVPPPRRDGDQASASSSLDTEPSRRGDGPRGVRLIRLSRDRDADDGWLEAECSPGEPDTTKAEGATMVSPHSQQSPVRIVIVSDTHGYESTLTTPPEDAKELAGVRVAKSNLGSRAGGASSEGLLTASEASKVSAPSDHRLPEGDILIHCGDYQIDAGAKPRFEATQRFDRWLAAQPAASGIRIVVRGNHDHLGADFPESDAIYAVRPKVIDACGLRIGLVPFSRGRLKEPLPTCDILVTHVPPKGVLDKCYNGDRAGSRYLHEAVCSSLVKPKLWLCGHIHEGYGFEVVRFGSDKADATLVVNAANANAGRANRLIHAPVVVDIPRPNRRAPLEAATRGEAVRPDACSLTGFGVLEQMNHVPRKERRLLAVDLGLRTGLALYDGAGRLLRYEQYPRVEDALSLGALAESWLDGNALTAKSAPEVEVEVDEASEEGESPILPVTHLAIEGGDVELRDEWDAAALRSARRRGDGAQPAVQVDVSPEAWRRELLLPKERKSASAAKAAARLIARQVVTQRGADGVKAHEGKFPTDAAEAVLIGYYAARRLGWCGGDGLKAVQRYTNGAVVLK